MSPSVRRAVTGLAGAAALIAVVTVLSRVLGFGRWLVQSGTVGYAGIGTAYTSANTLPNVLFEVAAGGALAGALIPLLAGPLARGLRDDVDRIASAMLGWALVVLVPLAGLLALLAGPLAALLVGDAARAAEQDLVRWFVLVFAVQVPLYGVGVVLVGVLQAHHRFLWPALAPVFSSLVVIGAYLAYGALAGGEVDDPAQVPDAALAWLGWGTTAGVAAMSLPLLLPLRRTGVRLRPTLRFPAGVAGRARSLAFAGVGALVAQQAAVVAVLLLANRSGGTGAFPVYQYTQAVFLLPYAVLAVPLATSSFPRLAARAATGDLPGYARLAATTTRAVLVVAVVGAAALAAAAPAVGELFRAIGRGDPELTPAMGPALTWMAPGLLGFALLFHLSRALYALERGRLAVLSTASGWLVVVVASVALCAALVADTPDGPATLVALGAAHTLGMTVAGVALLLAVRRAAGRDALHGVPRTVVVLVVVAALAAVAGRRVTGAVAEGLGSGVPAALASGAAGAVLAAVLVAAGVGLLDRGAVRVLRSGDGPAVGPHDPGPHRRSDDPGPHRRSDDPRPDDPRPDPRRPDAPTPPAATGRPGPDPRRSTVPDPRPALTVGRVDRPVRVLQVLGSSAGGVARHVAQLGEALSAPVPAGPGWDVRVAGPTAVAAEVAPAGGRVGFAAVEIADRPRAGDVAAVRRLRTLARETDVLHAHGLRAGALAVLAVRAPSTARRPRIVVTLHNLPVGGRAVRTVSAALEQVVARGADVVLGVSGDLVERARARGAAGAERALVPAPAHREASGDVAAVRRSLGVGEGGRLVVTVARLAPQKGLDTLLDAAAGLGRDPGSLWVVAGDGPLRETLDARIATEHLPVRLLGRRGDVPDLLAAADVVVSTAVWEGQPLWLQEALAAGAPVVATDAGGTREVTGDDGAVLVPVGDAPALVRAVRALLDDPAARTALAGRARSRAAQLPAVGAVVDQLRRVYGR